MKVHLVDGTYELFRYYYALPSHLTDAGEEVAATRGVLGSMLQILEGGGTHIAVATDHVIESFRNDLWAGYKDGSGIDPLLRSQFPIIEDALEAAGIVVWAMVEFEADDALGAGAVMAAADDRVEQVLICTPDKDLGQCVTDDGRIVQFDRRKEMLYDKAGVTEKFGVPPESIPDYLALVGDTADGFPGLQGWGAKSAAAVLARYGHLEDIPAAAGQWDITVRSGAKLAATLQREYDDALLFRRIATIETDAPVSASVDDLRWTGPADPAAFAAICERIDAPNLERRVERVLARR